MFLYRLLTFILVLLSPGCFVYAAWIHYLQATDQVKLRDTMPSTGNFCVIGVLVGIAAIALASYDYNITADLKKQRLLMKK